MNNDDQQTWTVDDAVRVLTAEGYPQADVHAAIDSLINAGLELGQPDQGYVLSAGEMGVLRDQLQGGG